MGLSSGTLVADGLDHAAFAVTPSLSAAADLVISNQGSPMLMPASLLRGLFSAGQNVAIDPNGVISTTAVVATAGEIGSGSSIGGLEVVTALTGQDLVAVNQAGTNAAIAYSNFLGGVTIDQAQPAAPAGDGDTIWVAQGSNVMSSQIFSAIWVWIANKLPTYKVPVIEISTNINLDTTIHNGRILVCSQPVTLTPLTNNMGSGFQCIVINMSTGNLTLGAGFVSSSGNLVLTPLQSATLCCATYSGGTIAFAAMSAIAAVSTVPGPATSLSSSASSTTTITVSWQAPVTGGAVSLYIIKTRLTGTTSWSASASVAGVTTYQLTALQPATSYDIAVQAENGAGLGAISTILTVLTSGTQPTLPAQVTGLTATPTSATAIQLAWSSQSGATAATSFTVQQRVTGSSGWTTSVTGVAGTADTISGLHAATSYDFSIVGVNAAGAGPVSATVTAVTPAATQSVTSIIWALAPSGPYSVGSGAIPVNVSVTPAASPIQFGVSLSSSTPPTSWITAAPYGNLWAAYLATPSTAGTWYAWAEGLDGSAPTVCPTTFVVH